MTSTLSPLFAATTSFNQAVGSFLDFLFVVTVLLGAPKLAQGAWAISRGNYTEGIASVIAGFLCCMTVPIIRMFAGWLGVSL